MAEAWLASIPAAATERSDETEAHTGSVGRENFSDFCAASLPVVFAYVFHRCGRDRGVAEDLTQETFLAAAAAVRSENPSAVSTQWLIGVARHKLVDRYRRDVRDEQRTRALRSRAASPPDDVLRERAFEALEGLRPNQRAAMVLHYLDGLPVVEVAATLGKSVHATESLLARGRDGFRRRFEETGNA